MKTIDHGFFKFQNTHVKNMHDNIKSFTVGSECLIPQQYLTKGRVITTTVFTQKVGCTKYNPCRFLRSLLSIIW